MKTANAYGDILLTAPPENQLAAQAFTTAQYTAATRSLARAQKCAFLDHQPNFGDVATDYGWGNAGRQWMAADLLDPVAATGGVA